MFYNKRFSPRTNPKKKIEQQGCVPRNVIKGTTIHLLLSRIMIGPSFFFLRMVTDVVKVKALGD